MNGKMKTRLTSLLLCIVMLVGLMPTSVFAEDECAHTNAVFYDFEGTASSCFEPGVGGYWFCEDCSQYLDESKENGYWEELLASKIPATGHAFNADTGSCDNCGLANPVYTKVTSLDDINEEDLYIFVANVGDKYFVLGGLDESTGDEQGNVWGHEDGNAIEVIPYEDGSISLLNQNYVGTMKPSEFMLDVNPDQWNFTEIGLTTVMPLLPNYCVYSFQSYDLHNTGYMGVPRYADGMYGMWDGGAWAIDFYTTEVDENTYRDDMDGYTHAEQVARGNIDDNIAEGDLLMYPASFYSVGGAMFTLRFREYVNEDDVTEYYFICGEDGYLVGSGEWDSVTDTTPTNDIQYAISLYRYDVPSTPAHTCDFGDWVADTDSDTHTRTCKDTECGKTETKSHNWDNGVETKTPTCTEKGEKTFTCSDCKATKTEAIDALDHDWSTWSDDGASAATDTHTHRCQREGCTATEQLTHVWGRWIINGDTNHKKTCSICSGTRTDTHKWDDGVITTQPTEDAEGVKTYTCSDCGHTKTEPVDKLEHVHSWSDWGQNNETTHIRFCRCNETQTEGHNFDDGVVINWPTHLAPGEIHYTCTDCGYVKIGTQPALEEHEWSDWIDNKNGTHTRSCICNETETKDCSWDAGVVTEQPTHYEEGVKTYTCTVCSGTKTEAIAKTTEHEWSDWSDNNDGTHTRSCRCNANETLAHTWDSWVVQNDGGYKRECADCGAFETMTLPEDKPVNTTSNDNAANTNLTNTDIELIENVLTDEEQSQVAEGAEVKVYLKVEDISDAAPAEHKEEAEAKAGDDEIGMYLDIDLFKQVGTAAETPVTETSGKVAITITIPDNLINTDASITRTYKIIRVHEDENGNLITDVIEGVFNPDDNSFTFETDKFSTYALAYADNRVTNTPAGPNSPQTGDNSNMMLWIALLFVSGFGVVGTTLFGKKKFFVK